MPDYVVSCRSDLAQPAIDELHARGLYLGHGGECEELAATGPPIHRLLITAAEGAEALPVAREVIESAGGVGANFELEAAPLG
jgi:hypothetical protein